MQSPQTPDAEVSISWNWVTPCKSRALNPLLDRSKRLGFEIAGNCSSTGAGTFAFGVDTAAYVINEFAPAG